jgi:glucokinase
VIGGASHQAGEIGQQLVVDSATGVEVTLEALASAHGIADRYRTQSGSAADADEIVARAGRGDAVAARVWDEAIEALADVLATAVLTVDPSAIVLGGGLSLAGEVLFDPLTAAVQRRLRWRTAPPVLVGAFGPDAGTVGVGLDALEAG